MESGVIGNGLDGIVAATLRNRGMLADLGQICRQRRFHAGQIRQRKCA